MPTHEKARRAMELAKRKHSYLFAGALLFLISFVAKDILRDYLKEKADSVVIAENSYLIRTDALRTSDRQITNLYAQRHAPKGEQLSQEDRQQQTEIILSNAYAASMQDISLMDALSKVASTINLSGEDKKKLADLEQWKKRRGTDFKRVSDSYFVDPKKVTPETYDKSIELISDAANFETSAFDFSKLLVDQADESKERRETLYNYASWLCYLLFFISWWVAFKAKTYELDLEPYE